MISIVKTNVVKDNGKEETIIGQLRGLSTDIKPTKMDGFVIGNGCVFVEIDTGSLFLYDFDSKSWYETGGDSSPIYGIERSLTSSSTSWIRTDKATSLQANATHDGSSVINDFDDIYPWSNIISCNILNDEIVAYYGDTNYAVDGTNGDVMTYIPKFFIRRWIEDNKEHIQISKHHFANSTEVEPFYIGRYTTSSGVKSISEVQSTVNQTIAAFRTQANSKGDKWSQLDWHMFIIQCLYLVEYANNDSQSVLGQGVCSVSAQVNTGGCDSLGMKSGCLANAGATAVIYRGIENIFGNIWQFVDGINIQNGQAYVCYDHSQYVSDIFTSPYNKLGYVDATANGYVYQRGYDSENPLVAITSAVGTSTYGDYYWYASGNRIMLLGGAWNSGAYAGLFSLNCNADSGNASVYRGSRLIRTH